MKGLILGLTMLLPLSAMAEQTRHEVIMAMNIFDDQDRAMNLQHSGLSRKTFDLIVESDPNLSFLNDIGYEYIAKITVDINNNPLKNEQFVSVMLINNKIIFKSMQFFVFDKNSNVAHFVDPARLNQVYANRELMYLASVSY